MPIVDRCDGPGKWHHVTNRAVARRPFFESREDARYFLSLVARAVRRGWIEVHCFAILVTHFHLLVRSPTGELSRALAWIQSRYVARFNRRRGRDGPLVKSRFVSKPVTDPDYRRLLVGYIDWNPVDAGLCTHPFHFEHGSARRLASGRSPKWLTTAWIERQIRVRGATPGKDFDREAYAAMFRPTRKQLAMVAYRLRHPGTVDGGRDLLHGSLPGVRKWLEDNARLADGSARLRAPVATVETVLEAVQALGSDAIPRLEGMRCDPRRRLAVGLMRQL